MRVTAVDNAIAVSVLVLALSACGEVLGGPCSLEDPCEEGICNLSGPGDPVCIAADGDLDGDGLLNRNDFCNQQAGGAFDEDQDGQGDDCDACPISRPPDQPDTDGDEVESPCDPDPTMPGNKMIVWNGFNDALPTTGRREGMWEARGGEARVTSTGASATALLSVPIPLPSRHVAVFASYRVDRLDAGTENRLGVISMQRLPAGISPVACVSSRLGSTDSFVVDSNAGIMSKPFMNLFDSSGLYRVTQLIEGAQGSCAMIASTQRDAVSMTTPGDQPNEAGLTAKGLDARFQYFLVVQRPN